MYIRASIKGGEGQLYSHRDPQIYKLSDDHQEEVHFHIHFTYNLYTFWERLKDALQILEARYWSPLDQWDYLL